MTSKTSVTLTFAGDTRKVQKSFTEVSEAAGKMSKDVKKSGEAFDQLGDKAGDLDQRAMGFRDALTGVEDTMKGVGEISRGNLFEGFLTLGMGIGDLASAAENLAVPLAKTAKAWVTGNAKMVASTVKSAAVTTATMAKQAAVSTATAIASVGKQVVAWAVLSAQSLLHAAKVAAAWVISMGPIGIAIAAVIALVVVVVKNWDTIVRVVKAGGRKIMEALGAVWSWIKSSWSSTKEFIVGGIQSAIAAYLNMGNRIIGMFTGLPGKIKGALSGIGSALTDMGRRLIQGLINGIKNKAKALRDAVAGIIPGPLRDVAKGIIPGFATGGRVRAGQMVQVNEEGPEMFIPEGPGQIIPNHELSMGSAGGTTVNVNVTTNASAAAIGHEVAVNMMLRGVG